jgi:hypothetical protein
VLGDRCRDQLEPGVADQRRASIRNERDPGARSKLCEQVFDPRRATVLVQRDEGRTDAEVAQQTSGMPRVLCRNQIDTGELLAGPRRQIAQMADRR